MHTASDFRDRVSLVLRKCLPDAVGLSDKAEAITQLSGGASALLFRIDAQLSNGSSMRVCLRLIPEDGLATTLGAASAEVQAEAMRAARLQGAPVPHVLGVLPHASPLGEGLLMEWMTGESRGDRIARSPALASLRAEGRLGRQFGRVLAQIQTVNVSEMSALARGLIVAPLQKLEELRAEYEQLGICRLPVDYALAWLKAHAPPDDISDGPVLVHGDFRSTNVIVDPSEGILGVVDWELAHLGNRYEDIGWLCVPSWRHGEASKVVGGFADLGDFCQGYEAAGAAALNVDAIKWWTILGSIRWSIMCMQQALAFKKDTSRLENGVVGRRTSEAELDVLCMIMEFNGDLPNELLGTVLNQDVSTHGALPERLLGDVLPSDLELLKGVVDFLVKESARLSTRGDTRNAYLTRVAANAAGIAARGCSACRNLQRREAAVAAHLLGEEIPSSADMNVQELRCKLSQKLRRGSLSPEAPGLLRHLLLLVVDEVEVDQPKYASLKALRSCL
eukprot:TRINITY_DN78428_c0_g1_i1.p1 TRINITY_DN78428_c0_g1~~TRINITY_DN78428_c0_g1_i1.p1  ORF type:complete len:506 (-),score=91.28 TRINITY_DN78428_c0_g1_i1:198-1715(-)